MPPAARQLWGARRRHHSRLLEPGAQDAGRSQALSAAALHHLCTGSGPREAWIHSSGVGATFYCSSVLLLDGKWEYPTLKSWLRRWPLASRRESSSKDGARAADGSRSGVVELGQPGQRAHGVLPLGGRVGGLGGLKEFGSFRHGRRSEGIFLKQENEII